MFIKLHFLNGFQKNNGGDVRIIKISRIREIRPDKRSKQERAEFLLDDKKWHLVTESVDQIFGTIQPAK